MGNQSSTAAAEEWKSDARRAMENGTYCVICGSPFDIEGEIYNIDAKDSRFRWLYELRLLGTVEAEKSHLVASEDSIPWNVSGTHGIFLSEPATYSTSGSQFIQVPGHDGPRDVWYETMSPQSCEDTVFPLHEACLDICRRAIFEYQMKHPGIIVEPDLRVLTCLLNMRFGHTQADAGAHGGAKNDLFGLSTSSDIFGPQSVLAFSQLEWWAGDYEKFYANPAANFDTSSFVTAVLRESPRVKSEDEKIYMQSSPGTGLECLPAELIDAIIEHIPVSSVVLLHRTSKALYNMTPLDNRFWRDSLRKGRLYPHIRNLDTRLIEKHLAVTIDSNSDSTTIWDWRAIAQLLATKRFPVNQQDRRLHDIPHEYWNRCRIWSIIEDAISANSIDLFKKKPR